MLRLSRPVRLLSFAFAAAAALGCGSVATESTAAPPEALADGGVTLDAPVPVRPPPAATGDAAPAVGDAAAPASACSVQLTGSVDLAWQGGAVTAALETDGSGSNQLEVVCPYRSGSVDYTVTFDLAGVLPGPGTYTASRVLLGRTCLASSCPGDWDFYAFPPGPTCTVHVTEFDPQSRGGMAATFDCPSLLIEDPENPNDPSTVHLAGSVTLPAVVAGAPLPLVDAGSVPSRDAGAPNCAMQVSGAYTAVQTDGVGWAQADVPEDAGVPAPGGTVACTVVRDGVTYAVGIGFGADRQGAWLGVTGESWCTTGCTVSYLGPCDLTVTPDAAAGSPFDATFTCAALAFPGAPGVSGPSVSLSGSFHGVLSAPPPPS